MTSIILNGAKGKMGGKIIEIVQSNSQQFKIVLGIDRNLKDNEKIFDFKIIKNFPNSYNADAIIDFSHPDALEELLCFATKNKTPLVIATTGYSDLNIEKIKLASKKIPIFFSFNMSLGINLLLSLVKKSYKILKDNFDIEIIEKHHNQKIDAPSGTALMIANEINKEANGKFKYTYNRQNIRQKREQNEIGIHSIRAGTIVGEHEVIFSGNDETISISHSATSKNIFAVGAIKAAEFIKNKPAGLYNMNNLLSNSF